MSPRTNWCIAKFETVPRSVPGPAEHPGAHVNNQCCGCIRRSANRRSGHPVKRRLKLCAGLDWLSLVLFPSVPSRPATKSNPEVFSL